MISLSIFTCIVDVYMIMPFEHTFELERPAAHIFCRAYPFEFMVPLEAYIKSTETDYSIGMRVQMLFDVEESARR